MDMVRQRAFEADALYVHAGQVLADAAAHLAPEMLGLLAADAEAASGRILGVLAMLRRAADDLRLGTNETTAAEILALRGAATDPTTPLPSIKYILNDYDDLRQALGLFETARDCAAAACNYAARCCGHLLTAYDLLTFAPGLHDLNDVLEAHRFFATNQLEIALASTAVSAKLAVVAKWLVR
jgi:hypothetical protein